MSEISIVGLDLAKEVFQVHGAAADGTPVLRRKLRRSQLARFFERLPACLVGMEACAGAHHWARRLAGFGHQVRLVPPQYVKPYVKRGKTDAADAEAIAEAVSRRNMRFVPVKTADQQAAGMVLKARDLLVGQRTQASNALRAHLAELGLVAPTGIGRLAGLMAIVRDAADARLPPAARLGLGELVGQIEALTGRIERLEAAIVAATRTDEQARRLVTIPGVGAITAAAVAALVPDPFGFTSGRHFAAWVGLTPKPHASGGKQRLGHISKMGNRQLRALLVAGATAVLGHVRRKGRAWPWLEALLARRPFKLVAVALANKMARTIWALLVRGGVYRQPAAHPANAPA